MLWGAAQQRGGLCPLGGAVESLGSHRGYETEAACSPNSVQALELLDLLVVGRRDIYDKNPNGKSFVRTSHKNLN